MFIVGVLWTGKTPLPGSRDVIERFQMLGKSVHFVTNNPTKTRTQLQEGANAIGYKISRDNILSAPYATAKYLQNRNFTKKVYLIGTEGVGEELEKLGIKYIDSNKNGFKTDIMGVVANGLELEDDVGAVVVSFDPYFNYFKLLEASNYLKDPECIFIGTSLDEYYPSKNGCVIPATAPVIRAVEIGSGRKATIVGKPMKSFCESLFMENKIIPERTLMIGDTANIDILLGANCGFQTLLVGTGLSSLEEVHELQESSDPEHKKCIPDAYLPKLGDLMPSLEFLI